MKKILLSVAVLSLCAASSHAQFILFTDNFNADTLVNGTTSLINWTATAGNVDVIGLGGLDPYPGHAHYIDLDGTSAAAPTVLQSNTNFNLLGGVTYLFDFDLGKNGTAAESMVVSIGTAFSQSFADSSAYPSLVHQHFSITPLANTSGTIKFSQVNAPDNSGYIIDNVTLAVIPEPTSILLMGVLALPLTAAIRRRRK